MSAAAPVGDDALFHDLVHDGATDPTVLRHHASASRMSAD